MFYFWKGEDEDQRSTSASESPKIKANSSSLFTTCHIATSIVFGFRLQDEGHPREFSIIIDVGMAYTLYALKCTEGDVWNV